MRESSKAALCGIVAALAVVIMMITYISPVLVYTAPPFAGLILLLIVNEVGFSRAIGTYVAVSLLSLFLIADKEAATFFTCFFGFYPILRIFLDKKIKLKAIKWIIKVFVFNLSLLSSVCVSMYVFNIDYSDFTDGGKYMTYLFFLMMNIVFVLFDFLVARLQILYFLRLQKRFRKLFRY